MRAFTLVLLGLSVIFVGMTVGCKKEGFGEMVEGTVKFDGHPLESGRINFLPSDGKGPTAAAEIKDGRFHTTIGPGPKQVTITAEKVVGQQKAYPKDPNSPVYDMKEQFIPARYNTSTELKCEVKAGKNPSLDFDLLPGPVRPAAKGKR